MTTGSWKQKLALIAEQADSSMGEGGSGALKQGPRRQQIIRDRLLLALDGSLNRWMVAGGNAHSSAGREIDGIIDSMVEQAEKDGVDLDGTLLDKLIEMAAAIEAIQGQWAELNTLLKQR